MIDSGTLARLLAQGRAKGHLTNEDLRAALPVETMSADEIALVVVHLEDAGIAVELDESLLAGGGAPAVVPAVEISAPREGDRPPPASRTEPLPGRIDPPPSERPGRAMPRAARGVHWAVLGAIVLLALAAVAMLVSR